MGQDVASVWRDGGWPVRLGWTWTVDSTGTLARRNGVTSGSDGSSTTSYVVGPTIGGGPTRTGTAHGQVASDRIR